MTLCTFTDGAILNEAWWFHVVQFLAFLQVDAWRVRDLIHTFSLTVKADVDDLPSFGYKRISWMVGYLTEPSGRWRVCFVLLNNVFLDNYRPLLDALTDDWVVGNNFIVNSSKQP